MNTRRLCFLSFLLLSACGASGNSPDASSADTGPATADTPNAAGDTGVLGNDSGAVDAGGSDAAAGCNTVMQVGGPAPISFNPAAAPMMMGGVAPGGGGVYATYATAPVVTYGQNGMPMGTRQTTLRVQGRRWEFVTTIAGVTTRSTFDVEIMGSSLISTETCPGAAQGSLVGFTSDGIMLQILQRDFTLLRLELR